MVVPPPQAGRPTDGVPQGAPGGQPQRQGQASDVEVPLLPVVDRRGATFQQPLSTELEGEVPPVLCRRVTLESIKIPKQGKGWLDFG